MQRTTCRMQRARGNVQEATCKLQRARCNVQLKRAVCNGRSHHASHTVQNALCNALAALRPRPHMLHVHVACACCTMCVARCVLHDVCCTVYACMLHVTCCIVAGSVLPAGQGRGASLRSPERASLMPERGLNGIISTSTAFSAPFTHYQYLSSIFSTLYALSVP